MATQSSDFPDMVKAARFLSKKTFNCFLLYVCSTTLPSNIKRELIDLKCDNILSNYVIINDSSHVVDVSNIPSRLLKVLLLVAFSPARILGQLLIPMKILKTIYSVNFVVNLYRQRYLLFRFLLDRYTIDLILLAEDLPGLVSPLLIKAGHKKKVPSVILPYTFCDQDESFKNLQSQHAFSMNVKLNKYVGMIFRRWKMTRGEVSILKLPAAHVLAHIVTRTSPPDPFLMNSGYANVIGVQSKTTFNYCQSAGIPKNKMEVVGSFADDELSLYHNNPEKKRKVYDYLNLSYDKPILLVGGCPNQLTSSYPQFDFQNIEMMVSFMSKTLQPLSDQYHLVIRAHPNYPDSACCFRDMVL